MQFEEDFGIIMGPEGLVASCYVAKRLIRQRRIKMGNIGLQMSCV
jgi:hypothetical protein